MIEFTFAGVDQSVRRLLTIAERFPKRAEAALRHEAEVIRTRSMRLVPVNLSALKNSALVTPDVDGLDIRMVISYGGLASAYALSVHEHPSKFDPPSWEGKGVEDIQSVRGGVPWSLDGRGPKYLERPLMAASDGMAERLAKRLRLDGAEETEGDA